MQVFKTKVHRVKAQQFSKTKIPASVLKHTGCAYSMCPICGGDAITTTVYYIQNKGQGAKNVREGDWIVKEPFSDDLLVMTDKAFKAVYELDY